MVDADRDQGFADLRHQSVGRRYGASGLDAQHTAHDGDLNVLVRIDPPAAQPGRCHRDPDAVGSVPCRRSRGEHTLRRGTFIAVWKGFQTCRPLARAARTALRNGAAMSGTGADRGPDGGGMFGSAAPAGRVFGVPLRIHWSAPLLALLLGLALGASTLPVWAPGHSRTVYTVAGLAGALLVIASLVLHEGAHAVTARHVGVPVRDMTVWALGGLTRMERAERPGAAFAIAVSGPLTSLVLGAAGVGAALGVLRGLRWAVPGDVLLWVGWVNVLLGAFNLLPAAPLDGGRVLQSLVWWRTGDRARGDRVAGRGGRLAGALLAGVGVLLLLEGELSGLWLVLVGFFMAATAQAELRQATMQASLAGVSVAQVMSAPVVTGPDWFTVDRFVTEVALSGHHSHLPVLDVHGRPSGIVSLRQLSTVPAAARELTKVSSVAVPSARCPTAAPTDGLADVMAQLHPGAPVRILVLEDGGRLVGIVTAHDVSRLLQQQLALRAGPARSRPRW